MKVGDLVKHFLTEQIGVVVAVSSGDVPSVRVLWTTRGGSLFGPGNKEWCGESGLDLLTTA
jgi:hypothetical protein